MELYTGRVASPGVVLPPDVLRNIFGKLLEEKDIRSLSQVCSTLEFRNVCFDASFWLSNEGLKGRTQNFYFRMLLELAKLDPKVFKFLFSLPNFYYDHGNPVKDVILLATAGDKGCMTVPRMTYYGTDPDFVDHIS